MAFIGPRFKLFSSQLFGVGASFVGFSTIGFAMAVPVHGLQASAAKSSEVGFAEVQSIFNAHCTRCHAGADAAGDLALDTYANLMKGGASGKSVVPGDSGKSSLVGRLLGLGGKRQMPLGFTALNPREIELIKTWINQGAKDSNSVRMHWAYVRPVRPKVPTVHNENGSATRLTLLSCSDLNARSSIHPRRQTKSH
jgi:mono/diheme cytochrome c family protein